MDIVKIQDYAWVPRDIKDFFIKWNLAISVKRVKSDNLFEIINLNDGTIISEINFDGLIYHLVPTPKDHGYQKHISQNVDHLISVVTSACSDSPKKKYNYIYEIAFSLDTDHTDEEVTKEELLRALKRRVAEIEATGEIFEAVGAPCDTCENF